MPVWPHCLSNWLKIGKIRDFFYEISVHIFAVRQNTLKSDLKSPGFSHFGQIITHFGPNWYPYQLSSLTVLRSERIFERSVSQEIFFRKKKNKEQLFGLRINCVYLKQVLFLLLQSLKINVVTYDNLWSIYVGLRQIASHVRQLL